ncbi:zinc-finger of the MIZ type in Nse subunit-domain-containing protein [Plectosphaerella plurivora]|uniref:Zinc-finger of the MIZ type in Nse subunit-domain-containing protein n=1 Tax=Plectosphaerella plurivora TaxID=936078 RepID=A0A9P9A817_9PEZI|nr:zinc-finger of the MIZ type in Nse subunit-domain-containing protein [Plectosphaerella plurivora]
MPLLGQRRRAAPAAAASSSASGSADLPPYEPLSCALSDEAKRSLTGLSNNRENTRRYDEQMAKSKQFLGKSVAAVTDRLRERQKELDDLARNRTEKRRDKNQREEDLERWLPKLEGEVTTLSENAEKAMRDLVDRQAQLEDDKEAAVAMAAYFDNQPGRPRRPRRNQAQAEGMPKVEGEEDREGLDDEVPPPDRDPLSVLEEQRARKTAEYEAMSVIQRYALHNDYGHFRKLWHDAKFGDGVPLPDKTRWFDEAGNPVQPKPKRGGGGATKADHDAEDDEEEDDDIVIEGEHQSYVCPLSMQQITEPFSNHKCRHTFQKQSIVEWLNETGYRGRERQCPTPGCDQTFTLKDFYLDDIVLRKIQRARKRQAEEEAEEDRRQAGTQDDDEDEEMVPARSQVKRERKRRVADDIDDEE